MRKLVIAVVAATSMAPAAVWADPITYTVQASATLSQFDTPVTQTVTSSAPVLPTLPTETAAVTSAAGNIVVTAAASPQALTDSLSSTDSGANVATATAKVQLVGLAFSNNAAFQNLFSPGSPTVRLLLDFTYAYNVTSDQVLSSDHQVSLTDNVDVVASGPADILEQTDGIFQITNSLFGHSINEGGVLAGVSEGSGSVSFSLPITVSFADPVIYLTAESDISGLTINEGFVDNQTTLTLPSSAVGVTTLDGTQLSTLGVEADPIPTVPVPEPASFVLLGAGAVALAAVRRHPVSRLRPR